MTFQCLALVKPQINSFLWIKCRLRVIHSSSSVCLWNWSSGLLLCVFYCLISGLTVRSKSLSLSLSLALPVLSLLHVGSSFEVIECGLEGRSDSWEKDRNGGWKRKDERIFRSCRIGEMGGGGFGGGLIFLFLDS